MISTVLAMGQTERADEAKARSLIEELLEIELQFSDHHGGVDGGGA